MPDDEKDRWGRKLHDNERGREEQYFAEREREMIAKLRQRPADGATQATSPLQCPRCGVDLTTKRYDEVPAAACGGCGGVWLEQGALETLARREAVGWLARLWSGLRR